MSKKLITSVQISAIDGMAVEYKVTHNEIILAHGISFTIQQAFKICGEVLTNAPERIAEYRREVWHS